MTDRVEQGGLLGPIETPCMFRLKTDRFPGEGPPQAILHPRSPFVGEGLDYGTTLEHFTGEPERFGDRAFCNEITEVFIHHIDPAARDAARNRPIQRLACAQGFFRALALGHIDDSRDSAFRFTVRICDGGYRVMNPDNRTIGTDVALFNFKGCPLRHQTPKQLQIFWQIVRMCNILHSHLVQKLLTGITGDFAVTIVDHNKFSGQICFGDASNRLVDNTAIAFLGFT